MPYSHNVQVQCQTSKGGYYLLSVYNLHLNAFLSLFPNTIINNLRLYWLDADTDYRSSLKYPVPVSGLNFQFDGLDIQILTVEIELSNRFVIDTNLSDELFCRVVPNYPVIDLVDRIKTIDPKNTIADSNAESISSLSPDQWVTESLKE